ncbi:MAG TPA: hypothetical protein VM869_28945 [Enhygromyxa sp.]|nr:hypothetical protein [Enhygromyxa sp.]
MWVHGEYVRSPESPARWLQAGRDLFEDQLVAAPEHARSLIGLGAMRDYFGHTDEAIALTRRALERVPESPTALVSLASYLARDPTTLDEARELAELAVELAADQRAVWLRLLLVCQAQADDACIARVEARLADL